MRFAPFSLKKISYHASRMREMFSYSIYSVVADVSQLLIKNSDSLVITIFRNLERVTPYNFAFSLARYGNDFCVAILGTLEPVFSQDEGRGNFDAIRRNLLLTTKISVVFCVLIFSGTAIYGHAFILRWLGREFEGLPGTIFWLSIAMLAANVQRPAMSLLYGLSKHNHIAWMNVVEGIANLILSIILIQRYDIAGVAMGTAIPALVLKLGVMPMIVCRVAQMPLNCYLNVFMLRGLAISISFNLLYYWFVVRGNLRPDYTQILTLAAIQSALFLGFAWLTVFSRQERAYLLTFFNRKRRR